MQMLVHTGLLYFIWNDIVYFYRFGVEHVPEEIEDLTGNKNIKANILQVQANNSIMCENFCIGFFDFMLAGKTLTALWMVYKSGRFNQLENVWI